MRWLHIKLIHPGQSSTRVPTERFAKPRPQRRAHQLHNITICKHACPLGLQQIQPILLGQAEFTSTRVSEPSASIIPSAKGCSWRHEAFLPNLCLLQKLIGAQYVQDLGEISTAGWAMSCCPLCSAHYVGVLCTVCRRVQSSDENW